jgi:hypothetical protein
MHETRSGQNVGLGPQFGAGDLQDFSLNEGAGLIERSVNFQAPWMSKTTT